MYKSIIALLISVSLIAAYNPAIAGKRKARAKTSSSSNRNLKESFRAIGHGFRDAGKAVGRDAKAATRAVKKSEKKH